jgi:long-chain acyl-CoA synthetase
MEVYTVKVEEATPVKGDKPSAGPVYRSIYARNGLSQLPDEINSPWDLFRSNSLIFLILT